MSARWIASAAVALSLAAPVHAAESITAVTGTHKIRKAPHHDSELLGLFVAGQTIALADPDPVDKTGCARGWYRIKPRGYVCARDTTTFNPKEPRALAARAVLPDDEGYPFSYGEALGSPRYLRWPDDVAPPKGVLGRYFDRDGKRAHEQSAHPGMKVAWAEEITVGEQTFLVTPELLLIPKDKVEPAAWVAPRSVHLDEGSAWPFALTLRDATFVPLASGPHRGIQLGWRDGVRHARSADGSWIAKADISAFVTRARPSGVGEDEKWVHVRVNDGALVAYEGDRAVFAAAISPGMHGANPKGEYRTPTGRYRISSKHLTSDMGGPLSAGSGGSWRSRDVPWVAYYDGSYALHGAWWHDRFGRPRSHGCINLTPDDARWLFHWLEPRLPRGWYAVRSDLKRPGTVVLISP